MSSASIALCTLAGLAAGTVLALLFGACAWRMGTAQPGPAITEAGHRAIGWGGAIALAAMATVAALERMGLPCML